MKITPLVVFSKSKNCKGQQQFHYILEAKTAKTYLPVICTLKLNVMAIIATMMSAMASDTTK